MDLDWTGISAFSHSPPFWSLCFHLLVLHCFPLWLCEFACLCAFKRFLAYLGPEILIHILFVWIYSKFRVRGRKWLPLYVSLVYGFCISISFQLKHSFYKVCSWICTFSYLPSTVGENDFSESYVVKVRLIIDFSGLWPKEDIFLFEGYLKILPYFVFASCAFLQIFFWLLHHCIWKLLVSYPIMYSYEGI